MRWPQEKELETYKVWMQTYPREVDAHLNTGVAYGILDNLSSGQFAWMTIYLPELFPTQVRGTAMSLVFDSSRSLAGLGPLLAGWMISFFGGIGTAAAVMSLIYVVGLIVTPFAGPETNGKALSTSEMQTAGKIHRTVLTASQHHLNR